MRFLRIVLALAFGLAMAGPETHACPVHTAVPVHHQDGGHHKASHCTCPQACCPAGVAVSMSATTASWAAVPLPVVVVGVAVTHRPPLPSRTRLLPFALAPPQLLG
jgi:hypothetical protein